MTWIPRAQALAVARERFPALGMDEKMLLNWTALGNECTPQRVKNRIGYDSDQLGTWFSRVAGGLVTLSRQDYLDCFQFAVKAYYHGITKADFNRGKQRDLGEFLTNQIGGKLGEIAVQKLLQSHGLITKLDFDVAGQIPSQDIVQISTRARVWDNPRVKVSIKATKLKNILLAISANEAALRDRISDVYILSQVGLFPNHILRIMKEAGDAALDALVELIPPFADIPARIAGWATYDQLTARAALSGTEIEQQYGFRMSSANFVLASGELSFDWEKLKSVIVGGQ